MTRETTRILVAGDGPASTSLLTALLQDLDDLEITVEQGPGPPGAPECDAVIVQAAGIDDATDLVDGILAAAPRLPVVVVTDTDDDGATALETGAQDHLVAAELTRSRLVRSIRLAMARRAAATRAEEEAAAEAEHRATKEAADRATRDREEGEERQSAATGLPDILLAETTREPGADLLSTLGGLLADEQPASITLGRMATEASLADGALVRAPRPVGNVLLALIERDMRSEADLVHSCFARQAWQAAGLREAMLTAVRTFATFWRDAPTSLRLAATYCGLDDRLRGLRYEHLRGLSSAGSSYLAAYEDEIAHDDPARARDVAVDQLLALLDQQLLLGALHPSTGAPEDVVAEFADQLCFFLQGPPTRRPAETTSTTAEPTRTRTATRRTAAARAKARTQTGASQPTKAEPARATTTKTKPAKTSAKARTRPAASRPTKAEPAAARSPGTKTAEAKPTKAKPTKTETTPTKTKPSKTKVAKTKAAKAKPNKPETKPETKPAAAERAETKPETKPAAAERAETEPTSVRPAPAGPASAPSGAIFTRSSAGDTSAGDPAAAPHRPRPTFDLSRTRLRSVDRAAPVPAHVLVERARAQAAEAPTVLPEAPAATDALQGRKQPVSSA